MNKPIIIRRVLSGMLALFFCLPVGAQDFSAMEGIALDENGELMKGVVVELFVEGVKKGQAVTGEDGSYLFNPILRGTYDLKASFPGYENVEITGVGIGRTTLTMDMNLTPKVQPEITICGNRVTPQLMPEPAENVAITGRLRNAYNRPAAGVAVYYTRYDVKDNGDIDTVEVKVVTNEKGCYRFEELIPGTYCVRTEHNGVKTQRKTIVIQEKEFVEEKIANFFFNRKVFNRFGELVENEPVVADMKR